MEATIVTQEELHSFHAAHFSTTSTAHFTTHFLGPVEEEYLEEEDDRLGYYADGVKRTLTDEQIAIFRHSEIQAILRARRHAGEENEFKFNYEPAYTPPSKPDQDSRISEDFEDGELEDEDAPTPRAEEAKENMSKKEKKMLKAKKMGYFKQHVKPDLRKRTWDKVDSGLGSLDYDEEEGAERAKQSRPARRRQISYDD